MNNCSIDKYLIDSLKLSNNVGKYIFRHPNETRFKSLFDNMLGLDKRTSIIIKNIPENFTAEQFKQIVLNFNPNIDFFYVPIKIRTRKKLRVAFVNVLNYSQIVPIYMGLLYKTKFIYHNPDIGMEICYSKVQGKNQLIQRFFHELNLNNM